MQSRERDYLPTKESLKLIVTKKYRLGLTDEALAERANFSLDSVKRLLNPNRNIGVQGVQRNTLYKIVEELGLEPNDIEIVSTASLTNTEVFTESTDSVNTVQQEFLSDIKVAADLNTGDIVQRDSKGGAVVQKVGTNLESGGNVTFGNVTQEY
jgi:cobalamin biosynthesis protein CbiG